MSTEHPPLVRTRLSIMMFLEFFVWGGWGFAITGYAGKILSFEGWQIGLLGAIPAIGAMVSPLIVGPIADRFFPAQRVLSVLHLLGGICLLLAGLQTSFIGLTILMMLNGVFFMPSIALVNSVAFRHIPDAAKFPRIAVLGTIGWIIAVLSASVFLGGANTPNFLFQSGLGSIVLALYCWTLPNTPPKGAEAGGDAFGLSALKLLKEPSLLIFIVCVFLVSIPACGYFFTLMVPMLQQRGYPSPLALTTLNQFAEIIFMFSMPWFVAKMGLKRVILIGMIAWCVRYVFFACPEFFAAIVGLILHGFCYSFFYVGSYMYVDSRVPESFKSSAQSLLTFLLIGVGWFVGSNYGGFMMQKNPAPLPFVAKDVVVQIDDEPQADEEVGVRAVVKLTKGTAPTEEIAESYGGTVSAKEVIRNLPPWDDPSAATSIWRYLDLSGTVKSWIGGDESTDADAEAQKGAAELGAALDANQDGTITMAEVEAIPDSGITIADVDYTREEMVAVFKRIIDPKAQGDRANSVTRKEWLRAKSCNWAPIWLWPAAGIFIVLVVFGLAFHDKPKEEEAAKEGGQASAEASTKPAEGEQAGDEPAEKEQTDDEQKE